MSRSKQAEDDARALINLAQRVKRYEAALRDIATRPKLEFNPDGDEQAAYTMAQIAEDALKGEALPAEGGENAQDV